MGRQLRKEEIAYNCPICGRGVPETTDHHLIPKSRGGKILITICLDCHRSIHAFFSNKELEDTYHTVPALMSHEGFRKHIKWLSKQDPNRRYKTKRRDGNEKRGRAG